MKSDPLKVKMNSGLPALTTDGLSIPRVGAGLEIAAIANSAEPEFPPPGLGFVTLTSPVPEFAISAAVICACSSVFEVNVLARKLPFHCTVDDDKKFVPVIVNVNAAPPALAEPGLKEAIAG